MKKVEDKTLIEIETAGKPIPFVLIVIVVCLGLAAVWSYFAHPFLVNKIAIDYTTNEWKFGKLSYQLNIENPQFALVGTSLTDSLTENCFLKQDVINLGFRGGSPYTGIRVLLNSSEIPPIVFVETNYWHVDDNDEPGDNELIRISNMNTFSKSLWGSIKPLRYLVAPPYFQYNVKDNVTTLKQKVLEYQQTLLSSPINDYKNEDQINKAAQQIDLPTSLVQLENIEKKWSRLEGLVDQLEKRGSQVFYIQIPVPEPYQKTEYYQKSFKPFAASDNGKCNRCFDLNSYMDSSVLRWADGVHLDERSRIFVCRAIEKFVAEKTINPSN